MEGQRGNEQVGNADPVYSLAAQKKAGFHNPFPQIRRIAENRQGVQKIMKAFIFPPSAGSGNDFGQYQFAGADRSFRQQDIHQLAAR